MQEDMLGDESQFLRTYPLFSPYLFPFFFALWVGLEWGGVPTVCLVIFGIGIALFLVIGGLVFIRRDFPVIFQLDCRILILVVGACLGYPIGAEAHAEQKMRINLQGYHSFLLKVKGEVRTYASGFTSCQAQLLAWYDSASMEWNTFDAPRVVLMVRDSLSDSLAPADILLLYANYVSFEDEAVRGSGGNPNAFSFERWQRRQGIMGNLWAKASTITHIYHGTEADLSLRDRLRHASLARLRTHPLNEHAYGLSAALGVAARRELSRSVRETFSAVGIAHILALSGLHVGMVYAVLSLFTRFIPGYGLRWRIWRMGIPLLFVWFFAFYVGFSPSLLRATLMITAFVLPMIFFLSINSFDSLAFAAFIILLLCPTSLYDVGFHLSFSSVMGIMFFYRPLRGLLPLRGRPIYRYLVDLLAVSLAAQIGSLPFLLLHFGRLPVLALVANLFAIPLVSLILPLAFVLILVPSIPPFTYALAYAQNILVTVLVKSTTYLTYFPWVEVRGLRMDSYTVLALVVPLLVLGTCLVRNHVRSAKWSTLLFLPFAVLLGMNYYNVTHSEEIVVFHKSRGMLVAHRDGMKGVYYTEGNTVPDSAILSDYTSSLFHAKCQASPILPHDTSSFVVSHARFQPCAYGLSITMQGRESSQQQETVLVVKHAKVQLDSLLCRSSFTMVVLDGGVPYWRVKQWKRACEKYNVPYWDTRAQGAYILPWSE